MPIGLLLLLATAQTSSRAAVEIVTYHNSQGAPESEAARWVVDVSSVPGVASQSVDHPMGDYGLTMSFQGQKGTWEILLDATKAEKGTMKLHYSALLENKAVAEGNTFEPKDGKVYLHLFDRGAKSGIDVKKRSPSAKDLDHDVYITVQVVVRPAKEFASRLRANDSPKGTPLVSLAHVDYQYRIVTPERTLYSGHYTSDGKPQATIELNHKDLVQADQLEFFPTSFADGKLTGTAVLTLSGSPYIYPNLQVQNGKKICIAFPQLQHQIINGQEAVHVDSDQPRVAPNLKPKQHEVVLEFTANVKER